ncbi:Flp family type IVb pilin [Marinomonas sp. 2405UD66-6]|uniref:Flp family type IVb pilin n=1 Tax=Marinomonas sp. 2405UD66-6 TaxID=3391834 RepID=UPI0039C9286B
MFTKLFVNVKTAIYCFAKNREGVTAIEYAVIAVAVSAGVYAVFSDGSLTTALDDAFTEVTSNIKGEEG